MSLLEIFRFFGQTSANGGVLFNPRPPPRIDSGCERKGQLRSTKEALDRAEAFGSRSKRG